MLKIVIMLVSAITLVSCGGGSSDTGSPSSSKSSFNVSNQTATDFAFVSIYDRSQEKVVYEGELLCAKQMSNCRFDYSGPVIVGSAVFTFKNKEGYVVAFYDTPKAPEKYLPMAVTGWTTGAYLYEELIKSSPTLANLTDSEETYLWRIFSQNYGGYSSDTHYEKIAAFYATQTDKRNVPDFVNALAIRLQKLDSPTASGFNSTIYGVIQPTTLKLASDSSYCGPGSNYAINFLTEVVGDLGGGLWKPFFNQLASLANDACNKTAQDTRLDTIVDKLNTVQDSVDNIQNSIGQLSNFVAKLSLENKLKLYNSTLQDLVALSTNYQNLKDSFGVADLKAYVIKKYGSNPDALERALADPQNQLVLLPIIQSSGSARSDGSFLKKIDNLTDSDITLIEGLNLLCKNPDVGDLVELRSLCNGIIASLNVRIVAAQRMALLMASDGFALLDAYPSTARAYGYDLTKSLTKHKDELQTRFYNQSELLANSFKTGIVNQKNGNGYFYILEGVPDALMAKMNNLLCYDNKENVPLIASYVKGSRDDYLITNCKTVTGFGEILVQARLFIKVNHKNVNGLDQIRNILGVLVPQFDVYFHFIRDDINVNKHTSLSFINKDTWRLAMRQSSTKASEKGTFTRNDSGNFWAPSLKPNVIIPENYMGSDPNKFIVIDVFWNSDLLKDTVLYQQNYNRQDFNDTWFRYTDDNGFSYVFLKQLYYNSPYHDLLCLSPDCSGSSAGLSFINGPRNLTLKNADTKDRDLMAWQVNGLFINGR